MSNVHKHNKIKSSTGSIGLPYKISTGYTEEQFNYIDKYAKQHNVPFSEMLRRILQNIIDDDKATGDIQ